MSRLIVLPIPVRLKAGALYVLSWMGIVPPNVAAEYVVKYLVSVGAMSAISTRAPDGTYMLYDCFDNSTYFFPEGTEYDEVMELGDRLMEKRQVELEGKA